MKKIVLGIIILGVFAFSGSIIPQGFNKNLFRDAISSSLQDSLYIEDKQGIVHQSVYSIKEVKEIYIESQFVFELNINRLIEDNKKKAIVKSNEKIYVLAKDIDVDLSRKSIHNPFGLSYKAFKILNFEIFFNKKGLENKFDNSSVCEKFYLREAKDNKKIAMLFYDNKNCSVGVPQLELEEIQLKNN